MSQELLPCPWCQPDLDTAGVVETSTGCWVGCGKCGATGPFTVCGEDATSVWNTRPTAQAVAVDDARRLDWLLANPSLLTRCGAYWFAAHGDKLFQKDTAREAIDAAIQSAEA